jgi:hypothetical protein
MAWSTARDRDETIVPLNWWSEARHALTTESHKRGLNQRAPNSAHPLGGQDVSKHVRKDSSRRCVVADEVRWSAHRVAASA